MICATVLVGKDASYNSSTIIVHNEDFANDEFSPKRFIVMKPEEQPREYKSVISRLTITLSNDPLQYTAMSNADLKKGAWGEAGVSEVNVAMSTTETLTTDERVLGADPFVEYTPAKGDEPKMLGGIGEEDFLTIMLPYIKTACEGVQRLDTLLEEFDTYGVDGVAFSDSSKIWWLETVGDHHWIAKRVPDEACVTMPDQLGIDESDLEDALGDQEAHMCFEGLAKFIETNHLDFAVEDTTPFNPRGASDSHSDFDHVYNTPHIWHMQCPLNPYGEVWDDPDADCKPASDDVPQVCQPECKMTIEDIKYTLSSHYQGTPFDPYGQPGDEHTCHTYRTIGINRQGQLAVMQIRLYRPQAPRIIQWMAYGSNPFNTLVPFLPNVDTTPVYLEDTITRVTSENLYWANRIIATLCDGTFRSASNAVEHYQEETSVMGHHLIAATDEQITRLGLTVAEEAAQLAAEEEFRADDMDDGVQPITPDETVAVLCNPEVREILAAANQTTADQLKEETEKLFGSVLYTRNMEMKNGLHMSGF